MHIILFAIFGLVVGAIAKLIMPGRDPGGLFITAIIGMVGALLGGILGRMLLGQGPYYQAGWIMSIVGAIVLLGIYRLMTGRRPVA
jgi:uncharacterized membrane protein YeaQ/YmgE (transglycosylase-associated protein family)